MDTQKSPLAAPTIPVAQADGLIKTNDLTSDVLVYFPLWSGSKPKDLYQLTMNGVAIGNRELIPDSDSATSIELSLEIPIKDLNEDGSYSIGYQVTSYPGGGMAHSDTTVIRIDRTPPGGPLLAPMLFPNISLEMLKGRLAAYSGIEPGDMIQTVCNGTHGPSYRIHPENLTTLPIEIAFTREFLEGLFSDKINITYHVTDRAGNRSILAQSVELTLQR
jgi:hypothetical protein